MQQNQSEYYIEGIINSIALSLEFSIVVMAASAVTLEHRQLTASDSPVAPHQLLRQRCPHLEGLGHDWHVPASAINYLMPLLWIRNTIALTFLLLLSESTAVIQLSNNEGVRVQVWHESSVNGKALNVSFVLETSGWRCRWDEQYN
ncbi:uncharacterized protein MYCFIDRAFT_81950 [Pseudocercospora fijiensis CIRAD86]|uniref:Uncharacterized protein n=1 Tax=Pseudocercospora fijiensis (strain CIRAD86) TaxID=383855 RepID=M3B9I8_PSEFD|nr:uncharacterized protein MYCFIDRAFT_81950 [Pseudocercospora fijiensis CIRAD86]EME85992.1 hypothetical protein MYCFIDRAFT_81950 [Pseudocercospora fijiensis CIRAD86]